MFKGSDIQRSRFWFFFEKYKYSK